jgi:para-nitrobenzyl esterase
MAESQIVETSLGALRGRWWDGVVVFHGVPYAAPPIGERRFAPPALVSPWRGLLDATEHGPIAPQSVSRLAGVMGESGPFAQDEDCLTLTIATPAADSGKRPVMVFLHGGAWMTGAGSLDWYDGATLAREGDIVVIGINYRLGALGYLCCDSIGEGNFGQRDQAAALRWVHDHVGAFGGDPGRITLMGQSAGASSIGRLLLDDATRPLFSQAILQSGGLGRAPISTAEATQRGARLCALLEIDPAGADAAAGLRAVSVPRILAAQDRLARENARFGETTPAFMPTVDNMPSAAHLNAAIAAAGTGKRFLLGATREECHAFFALNPAMQDPAAQAVAEHFGKFAGDSRAIEHYRARRPDATMMDLLADVASDYTFIWPTMRLAEALTARGIETYAYRFSWSPPGSRFKACHTIELPFLFGNFDAWRSAPMLAGGEPGEMAALGAAMRTTWVRFIHGEAPDLAWPRYQLGRSATMVFDRVVEVAGDAHGLHWRGGLDGN